MSLQADVAIDVTLEVTSVDNGTVGLQHKVLPVSLTHTRLVQLGEKGSGDCIQFKIDELGAAVAILEAVKQSNG